MTGPSVPTNEEIVESFHQLELEGGEQSAVTDMAVAFIATQKQTFNDTVATMQAAIDSAVAAALPADLRTALNDGLKALKGTFDLSQAALSAAITAPTEPVPEPIPDPVVPLSGRKRR